MRSLPPPRASNPVDTSQLLTIAGGVAVGVIVAELAVALFKKIKAGA
jgi:hypothetical protein